MEYNVHSVSNITCWNASGTTVVLSYLETLNTDYSLQGDRIYVLAGQASNFTQLNITYVSSIANTESGATDIAQNVFTLAPIIALVVVAAILLGVVLAFGRGRRGGGL
jgi:hypothetical protein